MQDPQTLKRYFGALIAANPVRIREVIELRLAVEPEIAALAATRRTDADLKRMARLLEEQEAAEGQAFADKDSRFHMAIAKAAANEVIWEMAAVLSDLLSESRAAPLLGPERRERSLAGHRRVFDALAAGDPQAARQAMREHLAGVGEHAVGAAGR